MNTTMNTSMRSAAVSLLFGLVAPQTAPAEEFHITSITPNTNGVRVTWTNPEPGYAYTLQERDSLTAGNWSNAPTRYGWPGVMTHWTEPRVLQPGTRFYRIMGETVRTPERGMILSSNLVQTWSLAGVQTILTQLGWQDDQSVWPVQFYKITYETVDPFGLPITASGAIYLPQTGSNALPLFSFQHGTQFLKSSAPSQGWTNRVGLLFASSGYVALLPDYLGLGDSPGYHPYLHARSEATAVVDFLRAARTFCVNNGIRLNTQLFLAGYSQGGHATMAAQREIETYHSKEFAITASAPMAGPYDLSGTLLTILNNSDFPIRAFFPYGVAGWLPIYRYADTLEELLRPPYDQTLAPLLDGFHSGAEVHAATPADEASILYPDNQAAFLSDSNHPMRLALADNDLLDWTPHAPMHLYQCSGDDQVPYTNMAIAYQTFTNNGACCVEMIDPGAPQTLNHDQCFSPSLLSAKAWFDSLRE